MAKHLTINIDKALAEYNANNEKKITLKELADLTGVTTQTLYNYRTGKIPKDLPSLYKIAEITNYPIEKLITHENI